MTVVRKCDRRFVSWWAGVKWLEEVHHMMESVTVIREM